MPLRSLRLLLVLSSVTIALRGASAQSATSFVPPSVDAVRELLSFLASDELGGRDTPSRGLALAAAEIEARFRAAGLEPGVGEGYRHRYGLAGRTVDSRTATLVLHAASGKRSLEPVADFRVWEAAGPVDERDVEPHVVSRVDPSRSSKQEGAWRSRPLLVEVPADSALWNEAGEQRSFLSRRPRRALVLVREGLLTADVLRVDLAVPDAASTELELSNVVGLVRGAERPEEIVLVTAHYDHVGVQLASAQEDVVYNGADDDATGTTAVVLLAEAFAKARPKRSIAFLCVSGEEKGLLGSRAFADDPPFDLSRVVVNLNVEMIGRPPEGGRFQTWITGDDLSNFRAVAQPELARAGLETIDFRMASMLFRASDNYSFARKGLVAHTISAGSLHEDYHQPSDEASKVDFEHMTRVIGGLGHVLARFADPAVTFAYNERGRRQLGLDR